MVYRWSIQIDGFPIKNGGFFHGLPIKNGGFLQEFLGVQDRVQRFCQEASLAGSATLFVALCSGAAAEASQPRAGHEKHLQ